MVFNQYQACSWWCSISTRLVADNCYICTRKEERSWWFFEQLGVLLVLKTLEYEWYISIKAYKFTVCEILKYFLRVHAIPTYRAYRVYWRYGTAVILEYYTLGIVWKGQAGGQSDHGAHTLIRMCSNLIMNTCLMISWIAVCPLAMVA